MRATIHHIVTKYFEPKALVLMYHRIAKPDSDIWDITVSPENFEQQLRVLKTKYKVVSLKELIEDLHHNRVLNNTIAITFDDGYIDNYLVAKPLLEKYNLPATFFIASGNTDKDNEFWWDELEHLILYSKNLPPTLSIKVNGTLVEYYLEDETNLNEQYCSINRNWNASKDLPPSLRCKLFLSLWQVIKPLPFGEQQQQLHVIRKWAKSYVKARPEYRSMATAQLQELAENDLFDIGAHTVSHAALAYHSQLYQKEELIRNREVLQTITGKNISLLAYPYGNYNEDTLTVASALGFTAAFTTEEEAVTRHSHRYRLGRFQVKNLNGNEFHDQLQQWKYSKQPAYV